MRCLTFRNHGFAGEGDGVAIDKIVLTIGTHTVAVRGHAVEDNRIKGLLSQEIRVAVVQRVRPNVTGLFRVTRTAAVSTVRGLGTPGVLARDVACRSKPERSVLRETPAVEDCRVRLYGAKHETATLGCKLRCFFSFITVVRRPHSAHSRFSVLWSLVLENVFLAWTSLCFSLGNPK